MCLFRNCLSDLFPGKSSNVPIPGRKGSKFRAKLGGRVCKEREGGASFLPNFFLRACNFSGCDFDRTTF